MDIGPINRIWNVIRGQGSDGIRRSTDSSADRDANGRQERHTPNKEPRNLSLEQENDAVENLNSMPSFTAAGLKAEIIRGTDTSTHVIVKDATGTIIRRMPYQQLIDLYLERHLENSTGRLLRKAA